MRYHELITEMPVRNWQTVGDFDQPQSMFRPDDIALVKHAKYQDKVRRIFAKVQMPIDMFFLNVRAGAGPLGNDISAEEFQHLTGVSQPASAAITMLYTSSQKKAEGGLPLTGWILAHKIGECAVNGPLFNFAYHTWRPFISDTRKLLIPRYGTSPTGKNPGTYVSVQRLFNLLLTMKSARDQRLFNTSEALAECVAQYLISGTVTFKRTGVEAFDTEAAIMHGELVSDIADALNTMRGKAFMN
jgi:hypothetical protein